MVRRKFNFSKEVPDLFLVANMHRCKFRIANNGVHRRADIMAHVVEEHRLRPRCGFRHFKRLFKGYLLFHFLAIDDIVIEYADQHAVSLCPVPHFRHLHTIPHRLSRKHKAKIQEERVFMLQTFKDFFPFHELDDFFLVVLENNFQSFLFTAYKEVRSVAIVGHIAKLSTLFRYAKQSRIDIDIVNCLELIGQTHDAFNIFLMFCFGPVLGINFHKAHGDKFRRFINGFRLRKYETRIFVLVSVKVPKHHRKAFLVQKLPCDIPS